MGLRSVLFPYTHVACYFRNFLKSHSGYKNGIYHFNEILCNGLSKQWTKFPQQLTHVHCDVLPQKTIAICIRQSSCTLHKSVPDYEDVIIFMLTFMNPDIPSLQVVL